MAIRRDDWSEWKRLVVGELRRISNHIEEDVKEHKEMRDAILNLKFNISHAAKIWGLLGGLIPAVIALVWWTINHNH